MKDLTVGIVGKCITCKGPVKATRSNGRKRRDIRFCKHKCYLDRPYTKLPQERFWAKVSKNGGTHPLHGQCWEWLGCTRSKGHGWFSDGGAAHRYSWKLHKGEITNGLCVLHKCDNPLCVNPSHLFLGTVIDNNKDMVSKNRQQHGERHVFAVLTAKNVEEIRSNYVPYSKTHSCGAFARKFGVTPRAIRDALVGKNWKSVKTQRKS